jgi:FkbM family methyltransferase
MDTRLLFLKLLETLEVEVICEVGSMDGTDALRFRRTRDTADIIALEPNPANFMGMQADAALAQAGIEVVPAAAADFDGEAPFYLVPAPSGPEERSLRGMSSLLKRTESRYAGASISTRVLRLDNLLRSRAHERRLAFWIDSEGAAFEALSGAAGIARWLQLVHVEVESMPCIGADQHLYAEVGALLRSWGFVEIANNASEDAPQFDAVFTRRDMPALQRLRIVGWLIALHARAWAAGFLARACPGCLHRMRQWSRR